MKEDVSSWMPRAVTVEASRFSRSRDRARSESAKA